jgi:GDPmannose 4,6-dehydratase
MAKHALICGISGQDGAYLTELLLGKGYTVTGTSRDVGGNEFRNLKSMGLHERVRLLSMNLTDFRSVLQVLSQTKPDEVYNLAGMSIVSLSFEQPVDTFESIAVGALNLLEAIRFLGRPVRLYNACSSECFGDTGGTPANEDTQFRPRSPYATARAAAFWAVANYRDAYGMHASSGILFNHESALRPARFVTRKAVSAACRIAKGSKERLKLGNLTIVRDWGWAPEYVDAMWRIVQADKARDYVVATGEAHSLEELVAEAFSALGLEWRAHVDMDPSLGRPTDPAVVCGDPKRIKSDLGWEAQTRMPALVRKLIAAEK